MIIPALICGMAVWLLTTGTAIAGQVAMSLQPDADTLAFVDYVKKNGQEPKSFILDKLANHKLVIYGETHKRKASWDLLKSILKDPSFHRKTGIIFLEMSSDSQEKMDRFFAGETMDREILLDILRSVQIEGWDDRGMYEFARLKERFSAQDVYITFTHMAIMSNSGDVAGLTRDGIFDYAFEQNGNKPVAFNLAGSPFGKERFDSFLELNSLEGVGDYENNFDGYIFLMPLKEEGPYYLLPELITEDFVQELRRRAGILGYDDWQEYGVKVKNITLDDVHSYYQKAAQGKYWNKLNE